LIRRATANWQDRVVWAVLLAGAGLLSLPHRTRLALTQPLQTMLLSPLRLAAGLGRTQQDLTAENARLALLAAQLAVENARLEATSRSDLPSPGTQVPLVRATVISRDLATFERFLVVSQGRSSGLRPALPVLTPDGVCGKVIEAGTHQSLVQTLLAPDARVAVVNSRTRVPALARPGRNGLLDLDYAPKESDFRVGDTIVTAGIGTVYPKGLKVGIVVAAPDRPEALFKPVTVKPLADIARVEYVFILCLPRQAGAGSDGWLQNTASPEIAVPDQPANQ
jgi:rod shape-determining protein MreC